MAAGGGASRQTLKVLERLLSGDDADLIHASLLYILAWLSSCPENTDLARFFPDLEQRFVDADRSVQDQVALIRQHLRELADEGWGVDSKPGRVRQSQIP